MNLAKKSQFHFSFFKVDSQNPKFNLEYLTTLPYNTLLYTGLFCFKVHRTKLHYTCLLFTTLHYTTLHYIATLHCIELHCTIPFTACIYQRVMFLTCQPLLLKNPGKKNPLVDSFG